MHLSLNVLPKEPLQSSNLMVVEAKKYSERYDGDGCHPKRNFEISNKNHPQTMHDLVQASKCDSTILDSSETCQGVEALQLLLMVMPGSHNSGKCPEIN